MASANAHPPSDPWHPWSPSATIAANLELDFDPQLNHAQVRSLAQAAKHEGLVAERLVPGYGFRPETVNCRRSPTASALSLKKVAFGLMTGPANLGPQTEECEVLFNYYNVIEG